MTFEFQVAAPLQVHIYLSLSSNAQTQHQCDRIHVLHLEGEKAVFSQNGRNTLSVSARNTGEGLDAGERG